MIPSKAFTKHYNGVAKVLQSEIGVAFPFDIRKPTPPNAARAYKAIWDTGATNSVITARIAQDLSLVPNGQVQSFGVHNAQLVNKYFVHFALPNGFSIPYVQVTECASLNGGFDVLIGMDIISLGDFAVTHLDGKTCMSFRMPTSEKIDFLQSTSKMPAGLNRQERRQWERDSIKSARQ